jgi:transcriptional regulator with GAF, ATPase, and Fis domain
MQDSGVPKRSDDPSAMDANTLHARLKRNWNFLGAFTVVLSIGLAVSLAPTLEGQLTDFWPWGNTNVLLLVALALVLTVLVGYLTYQQRRILGVRDHIERMERAQREVIRQQKSRLHALLNISRLMGAVSDPESMFKAITDTCRQIFSCDQATLMILNRGSRELEVRSATGHEPQRVEHVMQAKHPIGDGISGWVAEHQIPVNLSPGVDLSRFEGLVLQYDHITAAMVVPILVRDELVGVLSISSRAPSAVYDDNDLEALQVFAESAGACIRHSERAKWMRQMIDAQKERNVAGPAGPHPKPEPTT